jgi:hypothetical protein
VSVHLCLRPESIADELFAHAEAVIMSIGAPFVPIKHEG